jgi:hypothetical protein
MNIKVLFLVITFVTKSLFSSNSITDIIRKRFGITALKIYRKLQNTSKRGIKCKLDIEFLTKCKTYNVLPNFTKFKLYRSEIEKTHQYRKWRLKLLNNEIKSKVKRLKELNRITEETRNNLDSIFDSNPSLVNYFCKYLLLNLINVGNEKLVKKVRNKQLRKLKTLGISNELKPVDPNQVIFNFSSRKLNDREQFILALGLDFNIPSFKLNYYKYFLKFEKLMNMLSKHDPLSKYSTTEVKNSIKNIAHKYFYNFNHNKIFNPVFTRKDLKLLKTLANDSNIKITRPDKGKGVVIMDSAEYVKKINIILQDVSKFKIVTDDVRKITTRIEDKVNRTVDKINKHLQNHNLDLLPNVKSSGSTPGILYGLPKIHKQSVPLRPVLAAYNTAPFKLSKWLVKILTPFSINEYSLKNSYHFAEVIADSQLDLKDSVLVSYDVESLFTNIPVTETINIIINEIYSDKDFFHGLNKNQFSDLLKTAVNNSYFLFNNQLYLQTDGVSMGSPLGPTLANFFMNNLEKRILKDCPDQFKPIIYKRYVDDTFTAFKSIDQAQNFLNYINNFHQNIKFTMEIETEGKLAFLDTMLDHNQTPNINVSIFRKNTFTGLGLSFFSFCPISFKINAISTLVHRAYHLCNNFYNIHSEFQFIKSFFHNNGYPTQLIDRQINKFLNNIYKKKPELVTVRKKLLYVSIPYFGPTSEEMKKELYKCLSKFYSTIDFKIILTNPTKLFNFFPRKERLPLPLRPLIIYEFKCPSCKTGTYIGSSSRCFQIRIDEHRGVSTRTNLQLCKPPYSAIRDHCLSIHGTIPQTKDFKILDSAANNEDLLILESIYITKIKPNLNATVSAFPLHLI